MSRDSPSLPDISIPAIPSPASQRDLSHLARDVRNGTTSNANAKRSLSIILGTGIYSLCADVHHLHFELHNAPKFTPFDVFAFPLQPNS